MSYTRSQIERKLEKIVAHVEANPVFQWERKPGGAVLSCLCAGWYRFEVTRVWVFGSFARHAPECGDLDLLVQPRWVPGARKDPSIIASCVRRRLPDVDILVGTPEDNDADFQLADAILVWSREDRDWRAKIAAIPSCKSALRHPRATGALPLPFNQLGLGLDEAEAFACRLDQGWYSSEVVDRATVQAPTDSDLQVLGSGSLKTRRALRTGLEVLVLRGWAERIVIYPHGRMCRVGGFTVICAPSSAASGSIGSTRMPPVPASSSCRRRQLSPRGCCVVRMPIRWGAIADWVRGAR